MLRLFFSVDDSVASSLTRSCAGLIPPSDPPPPPRPFLTWPLVLGPTGTVGREVPLDQPGQQRVQDACGDVHRRHGAVEGGWVRQGGESLVLEHGGESGRTFRWTFCGFGWLVGGFMLLTILTRRRVECVGLFNLFLPSLTQGGWVGG